MHRLVVSHDPMKPAHVLRFAPRVALAMALTLAVMIHGAQAEPPVTPAVAEPVIAVAVIAAAEAPSAWSLAQAVYGDPSLRPAGLDEARARVLAGEAAPADPELRELGELRAGVHGDDGASRQLLTAIAARLALTHLLVVSESPGSPPVARLFSVASKRFDAAMFSPAGPSGAVATWSSALPSIARLTASPRPIVVPLAPSATASRATAAALGSPAPIAKTPSPTAVRPFYFSGWFWGVLGTAAFGAGALYFATRDNTGEQIHLQLKLPP